MARGNKPAFLFRKKSCFYQGPFFSIRQKEKLNTRDLWNWFIGVKTSSSFDRWFCE